jgi:endonuclease/exonuclease/phosphatase family metal-dependent hydrolase
MYGRKKKQESAAFALLLVLVCLPVACAGPDFPAAPETVDPSHASSSATFEMNTESARTFLKVMTLNTAHGRGNGPHQVFQASSSHKANLHDISTVIRREHPDIVALQEADGPSFWSGNFNHVEYLARKGGYSHYVQCEHADSMGLSYGTALLSLLPLHDPFCLTFETSVVTAPKGFLVSMIEWPGHPQFEIDVVSVHFDNLSDTVRKKQIEELIDTMSGRTRPVIVMGDFNCEWMDPNRTLQIFAEALRLKTFRPDAPTIKTFHRLNKRFDWIFVSSEFELVSHRVLPDLVSDHWGVLAELSLRGPDSG